MALLTSITERLDRYFNIAEFPPDSPFQQWVTRTYRAAGIDPNEHFEEEFLSTSHGLMARNSDEVSSINTIVFVSDEIIDKAIRLTHEKQLLITHHPLDFETSGRGFLSLSPDRLRLLREHGVSIYALHTPLDVHATISTGLAWARRLGLVAIRPYNYADVGPFGVRGRFDRGVSFDDLLKAVSDISGVPNPNFLRRRERVSEVGILAGGTDPESILLSEQDGCDVIITGTYYNLVQNEIGAEHRKAFDALKPDLTLSLIECSHFASESVVMRFDMLNFCRENFGLVGDFIPQDDPWH